MAIGYYATRKACSSIAIWGIERAAQEMTHWPNTTEEVNHPLGNPSLRGSIEKPDPSAFRTASIRVQTRHSRKARSRESAAASIHARSLELAIRSTAIGTISSTASISTPIGPPTDRATSETARTATLPPCEMEIEGPPHPQARSCRKQNAQAGCRRRHPGRREAADPRPQLPSETQWGDLHWRHARHNVSRLMPYQRSRRDRSQKRQRDAWLCSKWSTPTRLR